MTAYELFTDFSWLIIMGVGAIFWGGWWAATVQTKLSGYDKHFEDIKAMFGEIKGSLRRIEESLGSADESPAGDTILASQSPKYLNELGRRISKEINGKELIKAHLDNLDITPETNEYRIQEACFKYAQREMRDKLSVEEIDKLERFAFKEGVKLYTVLLVLAVEMRDAMFKRFGKEDLIPKPK